MTSAALALLLWLVPGADDFSGLGAGKPVLPAPLAALEPGIKEEALLKQLGSRQECFFLRVKLEP